MTTPHEAVSAAVDRVVFSDPMTQVDEETRWDITLAVIKALREDAIERLKDMFDANRWAPTDEQIVDAILGPPERKGK